MKKARYYPIYKLSDANTNVVDFYFNHRGYKRPAGDLGNKWVWASSGLSDDSNIAYGPSGLYGFISDITRTYDVNDFAVRCVRLR